MNPILRPHDKDREAYEHIPKLSQRSADFFEEAQAAQAAAELARTKRLYTAEFVQKAFDFVNGTSLTYCQFLKDATYLNHLGGVKIHEMRFPNRPFLVKSLGKFIYRPRGDMSDAGKLMREKMIRHIDDCCMRSLQEEFEMKRKAESMWYQAQTDAAEAERQFKEAEAYANFCSQRALQAKIKAADVADNPDNEFAGSE